MREKYRCIELNPGTGALQLVQKEVPDIEPNQVLVKVWGSPINPSDRLFCQGIYGVQSSTPVVPGFEGTGTVVRTGKSLWARRLLGRRVSGGVQGIDGFWSEYVVLPAAQCLPLNKNIPNETAACAFVNPVTAIALMEPVKKGDFPAFVQTAAASQLGRMIQRLASKHQIPGVHIVHRSDLKEALESDGFKNVLDSSSPTFEKDLSQITKELDIRYAIDAVAGPMTGLLAKNLPSKSQIVVYGVLSGKKCEVDPGDLIFRGIQVKGFWLSNLLREKNPIASIKLFTDLQKYLRAETATTISRKIPLEQVIDEIQAPRGTFSFGKTLVIPS